jgi:hypothetical protein
MFWLMVAIAGVLGVFATKLIAAQTSSEGLRSFAEKL